MFTFGFSKLRQNGACVNFARLYKMGSRHKSRKWNLLEITHPAQGERRSIYIHGMFALIQRWGSLKYIEQPGFSILWIWVYSIWCIVDWHGTLLLLYLPPKKALDYLAIGVHELANMSERRLERLVNPGITPSSHNFHQGSSGASLSLWGLQLEKKTKIVSSKQTKTDKESFLVLPKLNTHDVSLADLTPIHKRESLRMYVCFTTLYYNSVVQPQCSIQSHDC